MKTFSMLAAAATLFAASAALAAPRPTAKQIKQDVTHGTKLAANYYAEQNFGEPAGVKLLNKSFKGGTVDLTFRAQGQGNTPMKIDVDRSAGGTWSVTQAK